MMELQLLPAGVHCSPEEEISHGPCALYRMVSPVLGSRLSHLGVSRPCEYFRMMNVRLAERRCLAHSLFSSADGRVI